MTRTMAAFTCLSLCAALAQWAAAQEPVTPFLSVELNATDQQAGACRLIFMVENGLGADLSALVFETVLLDRDGRVILLTLFDFQDLPAERPRVRQFDLPDTDCDALGRVLLNDVNICTGPGLADDACKAGLRWSTRTAVEVLG